jgi:quinoprotein glucose dehydrogenase
LRLLAGLALKINARLLRDPNSFSGHSFRFEDITRHRKHVMTSTISNEHNVSRWARRCYAILLIVIGAVLAIGGVTLVMYGGSPYYVIAGLATGLSGILIWRRDRRGMWLYAATLVVTVAWAIWEIGFDGWGLVARLAAPFVLGLPLLLSPLRSMGAPFTERERSRGWPIFAGAMLAAVLVGAGFHAAQPTIVDPLLERGVLARAPARLAQPLAAITREDWQQYDNDAGGTHFSPLTQITPQNVNKLQVAWVADTGPAEPDILVSLEVTPINIGDALYLCNAYNTVISLDAETGHERWRYNMTHDTPPSGKPCRGVSYYRVPDATGLCAERILAVSQTPELFALDAATGKSCPNFGVDGHVALKDGMGEVPHGYYSVTGSSDHPRQGRPGRQCRGWPVLGRAVRGDSRL